MATLPPITPAFAWAHSDIDSPKKAKESPKPVSNPLLTRMNYGQTENVNGHQSNNVMAAPNGLSNGQSNGMRFPFSPMDNRTTLRQRRKPTEETMLPPKHSLTEGYTDETISSTPVEDTGSLVLWNETSPKASSDDDSWVLVYGFSSKAQYDEVLQRFDAFGRVISQRGGRLNWVSLRYESNLEAEKALCQQPCILSDGSVVGVCRMDQKLTQSLDWDTSPASFEGKSGDLHSKSKNGLEENDVIETGKTERHGKTSVCEKFLAFIFGWDDAM